MISDKEGQKASNMPAQYSYRLQQFGSCAILMIFFGIFVCFLGAVNTGMGYGEFMESFPDSAA